MFNMDVMIRYLPDHCTDTSLYNFFKPHLAAINIHVFACRKLGRHDLALHVVLAFIVNASTAEHEAIHTRKITLSSSRVLMSAWNGSTAAPQSMTTNECGDRG